MYYGSDLEMKNIADIVITDYEWIFKNLNLIVQAAKSDKPMLKLLEKIGIISPTNSKGGEYFIPCVLQSLNQILVIHKLC